jgi:hypothetical protein
MEKKNNYVRLPFNIKPTPHKACGLYATGIYVRLASHIG